MRTHNTGVVSSIPPWVTVKNAIGEEGNWKPPCEVHFLRRISEPCLWFLLRSKSNMVWNSMKMILARKAMWNHLMNSTFLEKTQSPVSGFCYARNRVCNAVCCIYSKTQSTKVANYFIFEWWFGRVAKAQCFESCDVYSRGFESRRWNH